MNRIEDDLQEDPEALEIAATLYDNRMVEAQAQPVNLRLQLTEAERGSGLWKKIEAQLQVNLATCRALNDENLNPLATADLRGKIGALKEFLQFAEEPTVEHPDTPDLGY
jgi:hypothetical protein